MAATRLANKLTPEQATYIAGFWDGEGTIGIWSHTRSNRPRPIYYRVGFSAANTNLELLESVRLNFGVGRIGIEHPQNKRGKVCYRLNLTPGEARQIIPQLLPYLRAKRQQALIAMEFLATADNYGRPGITDAQWNKQRELYEKCGPLNRRGIEVVA